MKRHLIANGLLGSLVLGLGLATPACTKKTPEQKTADIRHEEQKDIAEARKDEAKDVADARKDEAKAHAEANKEVNEARSDAQKDMQDVNAGAAGQRGTNATEAQKADKKTYQDSVEKRLDALDDRLDKAGKNVSDKDPNLQALLGDAKAKKEAAKAELKTLKDTDESAWAGVKPNVDKAVSDFDAAVTKLEQAH